MCHWLGRRLNVQSDQSKGGRRARVGSRVYLLRMLCASRAMRSMRRGRQQMASSPVDSPSLARSCDGTPRWCVVRDCLASSRLLPVLSARQCQRGNAAPCQFCLRGTASEEAGRQRSRIAVYRFVGERVPAAAPIATGTAVRSPSVAPSAGGVGGGAQALAAGSTVASQVTFLILSVISALQGILVQSAGTASGGEGVSVVVEGL